MDFVDKIQHFTRSIPLKPVNLIGAVVIFFLTVAVLHSSHRIARLEKRSSNLGVELTKRSRHRQDSSVTGGSTYVRWGRSVCPQTSNLIYEGVTGGQHKSQTGGGSNILCLPREPIWGNFTSAGEVSAYIYGAEYELSLYTVMGKTAMFSNKNVPSLHDHNIPCAVCQPKQPSSVLMIPARNRCYPGWIQEYSGYLMTSHYGHRGRHSYICIDQDPEADPAGYRNENGALFYPVQAACGSLTCPPYVQNRELTCVVCSSLPRRVESPP